jgi:hypothetical protein
MLGHDLRYRRCEPGRGDFVMLPEPYKLQHLRLSISNATVTESSRLLRMFVAVGRVECDVSSRIEAQ